MPQPDFTFEEPIFREELTEKMDLIVRKMVMKKGRQTTDYLYIAKANKEGAEREFSKGVALPWEKETAELLIEAMKHLLKEEF